MGLPYPKDLPDAWGMIKALEGQVKFLKSELEEWKLAAGESPNSKYVDLVYSLYENAFPRCSYAMFKGTVLGPCRLLVALAVMPKGCRSQMAILELVQNLSIISVKEEPQSKLLQVYLSRARKILKILNAPGQIILHWGNGYSMTDDLRAWVLSFADGGV